MPKVTIIGAGIAGLTAALRLAERGYDVSIYEQNGFVGGKFRAVEWKNTNAYHEHSYHMFLNWYHNFFQIAKDIGVRHEFSALQSVKFLRAGDFPKMTELVNFGALSSVPQNLFSGVLPIPDMFLYMYSVIDLLGTPMNQGRYHDLISVNAFAATRPYTTEASIGMYDEYLAKTFAVASYLTSAKAFQKFLEYGAYAPKPLYWALLGDSFHKFLHPLQLKLASLGVKFNFHYQATKVILDASGSIAQVVLERIQDFEPSLSEDTWDQVRKERKDFNPDLVTVDIGDSLILAVPHEALSEMLSPEVLNRSPQLGECEKLQSVPMASVHLHLKNPSQRVRNMLAKLPPEPVVLVDSEFKLSFVCNSALWPGSPDIYLNIVASDSRPLGHLSAPVGFTSDGGGKGGTPKLSLGVPVTTLDHILNEFRRFVPFEESHINLDLLQIDRNAGRELFINEVGSWQWRPDSQTNVRNLFLAGDFCKNDIDVVCLEGAAVSGLAAAEHVRRYCGVGAPIKIITPKRRPNAAYWPAKVLLAPYAVGAKLWSCVNGLIGTRGR